ILSIWLYGERLTGGRSMGQDWSQIRFYARHIGHFLSPERELCLFSVLIWFFFGLITIALWVAIQRWRAGAAATKRYFFRTASDSRPPHVAMILGFPLAFFLGIGLLVGPGRHWSQQSGLYELAYDWLPFFSWQRVPTKLYAVMFFLL